jgi:circadian clock protein KaiC
MPESDLVKTGIAGLDDILFGGIPRGNVILVEGAIGAGKTTMGVEFVSRGASEFNEPAIIVVFEVPPSKIMRDALGLGWDLSKLEQQRQLKIVFTTRDVLRQELQQADSVLLEEAAKIGARRIFIDGVGRLGPRRIRHDARRAASAAFQAKARRAVFLVARRGFSWLYTATIWFSFMRATRCWE